jgi:taspase (threonine aspartase 1)
MALLKNGSSALDAVEGALRLMEDREITNAGYGSNLTAHGTVECDATIVDHMGRSGAVGACSREFAFSTKK